jgi:glycosyltransferase involved in cell wall biosynthesis
LVKVLINAVSAKLGGAATYVQNLARSLAEQSAAQDEFVFVVPPERAGSVRPVPPRVRVLESGAAAGSYARRWWWDQVTFRSLLEAERPDVLFSSANFGMMRCPCPQVLLVRNPIYFSREYLEHVLPAKGTRLRAETALRRWLVCRSAAAADCVMTPSAAMLDDLRRFVALDGSRCVVNPYGVPRVRVSNGSRPAALASPPQWPRRILWVSHYADHKNLLTLLRAARILRDSGAPPFELLLTLDPAARNGQHTAMPAEEFALLQNLNGTARAVGVQNYEGTWRLYAEADVFVFPSLVESFGHPLVEAMAAGLPIVASDARIHREICGDAAAYFPLFDAEALAATLRRLLEQTAERNDLAARGRARVSHFLWEDHVARLLDVLRRTAAARAQRAA